MHKGQDKFEIAIYKINGNLIYSLSRVKRPDCYLLCYVKGIMDNKKYKKYKSPITVETIYYDK